MALEKVTLDNGLTIYNDRVPGAWNNDVSVFVPYGSVDEQPGHEGVAHVFEHCVHLQTDDFADRSALRRYATTHGMLTNANTSFTRTLYYANGLELEPNMHYLSQILQHTHFPEESVAHELKAVRREMAMRLDGIEEAHAYATYNAMFMVGVSADITATSISTSIRSRTCIISTTSLATWRLSSAARPRPTRWCA